MPLFQSVKASGLLGLLAVVSLFVPTGIITADTPVEKELARTRKANQTLQQVAVARLELEACYLDQIRTLRTNGHASWMEQSRQQVLVDSLEKQLKALKDFDSFVAHLENQVDRANSELSSEKSVVRARNPIKVYLPGSKRLAGWIEPDLAGFTRVKTQITMKVSSRSHAENHLLKSAEGRLLRAEQRCQNFAKLESAPAQWSQQAKLQRNLARAELNFWRFNDELVRGRNFVTLQEIDVDPGIDSQEFITADAQTDLQLATYKVAWAEANAIGRLKSAGIDLRRQEIRAAAIEQQFAEGYATAADLEKSRKLVENANQHLQLERKRVSTLKRICRSMKLPEHTSDSSHKMKLEGHRLDVNCQWPASILSDVERIRHLIDLRRRYFDLEGQREGSTCKLEFRQTWLKRLEVAAEKFAQSQPTRPAGSTELRASLIKGERRQIESLQLEIAKLDAVIQGCDETLAIMALEEQRFIAQSTAQDQAAKRSFVSTTARTRLGASAVPNPSMPVVTTSSDCRFSYMESRNMNELYRGINFSYSSPEYLRFTFDRRKRSPLSQTYGYTLSRSTTPEADRWQLSKTETLTLSTCPPRRDSSPYLFDSRSRYYGTYSSRAIYPFGILRADLRSRAPVGQLPWYLPGSPNNLR